MKEKMLSIKFLYKKMMMKKRIKINSDFPR